MDKLPKDMVEMLIVELSPGDFINFCAAKTSDNVTRICDMPEIWHMRLEKDFPYITEKFPKLKEEGKLSKVSYLEIFTRFSKMSERFAELVLKDYGKLRNFLSLGFKTLLYQHFYDVCTTTLKDLLLNDFNNEDWVSDIANDSLYTARFIAFRLEYFPGTKNEENFSDYWQETIAPPLNEFLLEFIKYLKTFE